MKQRTWLILAAVGAGAVVWHLSRKPKALQPPYISTPSPTPSTPRPVCSGAFRYGWWGDANGDFCWDFCEKKRVDDAVCELA